MYFNKTTSIFILYVCFIFGLILYFLLTPSVIISQYYSVTVSILSLIIIYQNSNKFKDWFLWFAVFYFLFYQFGTFLGLILQLNTTVFLDWDSSFSNYTSIESKYISYILSGLGIVFLAVLNLYSRNKEIKPNFETNIKVQRTAFYLFCTSAVFVFFNQLSELKYYNLNGYATLYTNTSDQISYTPFSSLWTNLYYYSYFVFLVTKPTKIKFFILSTIFILLTLLDSLKGSRGGLIITIATLFWYYNIFFKKSVFLNFKNILIFITLLFFIIGIKVKREDSKFNIDLIIPILSQGISTSQWHLSVFIENRQLISTNTPFFIAPLYFPVKYLLYGNTLIGQNEASILHRDDLTHVMAYTLNKTAYLSGFGMGSSILSEAYQYGLIGFFLILSFFYYTYRFFFNMNSTRFHFFLLIIIFTQVIFSPRDTVFLNTWSLIKGTLFYLFIFLISSIKTIIYKNHEIKIK